MSISFPKKLRQVLLCNILLLLFTSYSYTQNYNNPGGTINDCTGSFFDTGGPGAGNEYSNNEIISTSICPDVAGDCVSVDFTNFGLENNFDFLYINQGINTGTGTAMSYTGTNSPGTVTSFDPSGCLTFIFTSDGSATDIGWASTISCGACAPPPPCSGVTPTCTTNPPDICNDACPLGSLATPPSCPGGGTVTNSFCLSNVGANAELPYTFLTGCEDGTDMANPSADVWYSFVATGNEMNIEVLGLTNPSIGVYQGNDCSTIIGRGCDNGLGALSLNIDPVTVGDTYYVQISGGDITDVGDFTLNINSIQDCTDCLLSNSLTANPAPINGVYLPGETVEFCYTINEWNQTASNWVHSVVPMPGTGWDASTLVATTTPPSCDGNGAWLFLNSFTGTATGTTVGPAWGYDSSDGAPLPFTDGDPGNNYGDNCQGPGNTWTFCWQITTGTCPPNMTGGDLSMTVETYGDYETGSWTSVGCQNDPITTAFATISCCPQPLVNIDMNPACSASCTGAATVSGQGVGPYDYTWTDSSGGLVQNNTNVTGSDQATGLCPGTYTILVTDSNDNCSVVTTATITTGASPTVSISPNNPTICNNGSENLTATGAGGSGSGYTYSWTFPDATTASTPTITATQAGTYTVVLTDSGNCTASAQTTIVINNPTVTISPSVTNLDCTNTTSTLTASAGFTTYAWSNGGSMQSTSVSSPGDYTVTATDNLGCTATAMTSITQNPIFDVINISESCNPSNTAYTVMFDITGGSGNYLVDNVSIGGSTFTSTPITPGTAYSFTVTDDAGCSEIVSGTFTCPTNTCTSATGCFGPNLIVNGDFEAGNTGFTSDYDFSPCPGTICSNSSTGAPILCQYDYNIGTNPNDCNADWPSSIGDHTTGSGNMMIVDFPAGNVNPNNKIWCQMVTVVPNTDYCFSAYFINLLPIGSNQPAPVFEFTVDGTVIGTTASINETEQWETQGFQFNSMAASNVEICITSNNFGNVGYDLAIDDIALKALNGGTPPMANDDMATICSNENSVTVDVVTNDNPTTTFDLSTLSIESAPPFSSGSITGVDLVNGTITFTPNLGFSGMTSFSYQICDNNGCCDIATVTVNSTNAPIVSGTTTDITCINNGAIDVSVNGNAGFSYDWSDNAFDGQEDITVITAGTYTITVTDANGCTGTNSFTINANTTAPTADISSSTSILDCNVALITMDASGSTGSGVISYEWSDNSTNATLDTSVPGTYTVTVTDDANGCTASTSMVVSQNITAPIADISESNVVLDCNNTSALLDASGSSGTGTISYLWSDNSTNATISVSSPGTYTVTITDADNGCTASSSTTITEDISINIPMITTNPGTELSCTITSITLNADMGYDSYLWSNSDNTQSISISNPGDYTVTVTAANGCTATNSITITQANDVNVGITGDLMICAGENTTLDATTNNADAYAWSNNETTAMITVNTPGVYTVTVTEGVCTGTASVTVIQSPNPSPTIMGDNTICDGETSTLDAGSGYSSYSWSTGSSNQTIDVTTDGDFTVTVTNSDGCEGSATFQVSTDEAPLYGVINDETICTGGSILIGTVHAQGTSYSWTAMPADASFNDPNIGTPTVFPIQTTTYTLTATNGNCTVTESVTIFVEEPMLTATGGTVCAGELANLSATGTPAGGTFVWTDWQGNEVGTGADIQIGTDGSSSYAVTYSVGACTVTEIVEVNVITNPGISINASSSNILAGETNTLTVGNAPAGSTYVWTSDNGDNPNGNETIIIDPTESATYTVQVTTPEGCVYFASIFIEVANPELDIPNIFTPNGDDLNDQFYIVNGNISNEVIEFKVFDRWGELVHDNPGTAWDGTFNGKNMPSDIYVYLFKIRRANGEEDIMKGDVALMR